MKTFLIILIVVLGVLLLFTFLVSLFLVKYMCEPKRHTHESCRAKEESFGYFEFEGEKYDDLPKEDYEISSYDGYKLHTTYIPAKDPASKKFVILTHGHTYTKFGSVKYLMMFRKFGFHCVIYDNRGHGINVRVPVTMGLNEHRDLNAVIDHTYNRFGKDIYLGLHGESMGSAIEDITLGDRQDLKFVISDCGYYDLLGYCKMCIQGIFHIPPIFVAPAGLLCKLLYGFKLTEVSPYKCLMNNEVPICIIHGKADTYIYPKNAENLYAANKGYKEIHLFEGANHAMCFGTDTQRYVQIVGDFLKKIENM